MIGGKTVGVFISDIRADVTQVSIKHFDQLYIYLKYYIIIDTRPFFIIIFIVLLQVYSGDQILNINGHNTQGLTLYDASQLLQSVSGDLQLTVVENRASKLQVVITR